MAAIASPAGEPDNAALSLFGPSKSTKFDSSRGRISANDIAVLLIGPQRKIFAVLKSVLVWIPAIKEQLQRAQALQQSFNDFHEMQENTSSMQGQQQTSMSHWTPSEDEKQAITKIILLMAKSTPKEDCDQIRADFLKNTPGWKKSELVEKGTDPLMQFFFSEVMEDHVRQRKMAVIPNGLQGRGRQPTKFLEGNANVVEMSEGDFGAIRTVLEYIRIRGLMNSDSSTADGKSATQFTSRLVFTYIFAEKTGVEQLGNWMIDRLVLHYQPPFRASWLDIIELREHGLGDSRMTRMLLQQILSDIFQHGWLKYLSLYKYGAVDFLQWFDECGPDATKLFGMLKDCADTNERPDRPSDGNACKWHRHDKTPRCADGKASGGEP